MRKLLIVVDMQKDFIDGSLGTAEAQAIVEPLLQLVSEYDPKDIIATRDTHPENYLETQEGRNLPVVHCIKDSEGWQIDSRVQQAIGNALVLDKPTFGSCLLADHVAELAEQEELEIT
ncbi:MAG: cysteine hydrolase, partial [Oscillospiraceae bacterium]|nr:cysteine hydrolase [Oscillospiraceae bacterium]